MKSISLTQLSVCILVVYLASFIVSADQVSNKPVTDTQALNHDNAEEISAVEPSNNRFTFSSLDLDKNGKLSQKEVSHGNNNWLVKAFVDIDANADQSLTEQELIDFAAKVATNSKSTS